MYVWMIILFIFAVWLSLIIRRQMRYAEQNNRRNQSGTFKHRWLKQKQVQQKTIQVEPNQERIAELAADQLLFDQVAGLLFEQKIDVISRGLAEQIQQRFLNKMPAKCLSQVGDYDLGEWSIYWSYQQQSLEYYVGRYGVFYTHIDRFGREHKREKKLSYQQRAR